MSKAESEEMIVEQVLSAAAESGSEDLLRQIGTYFVWGEIKDGDLRQVIADVILKSSASTKTGRPLFCSPLTIIVNSPGGSLSETDALLDVMANSRLPVHTVGLGLCCSAGTMLLAAGAKGHRVVGPSTQIMIHQYAWGTEGKHQELVTHRKAEDDTHKKMVAFWQRHSRYHKAADVEKYLLPSQDVWLTPEEAVRHGVVDRIGSVFGGTK